MVSPNDDEGDTSSGDGNEEDYEDQVGEGEGEEGDDEEDDDTIKSFEGNEPKGSQHNS